MNRYRITQGSSKATPTTTCQKCLQKGHYSYECKASLQSRPYTSRASRSQQLRNPKLKPVLSETKLSDPSAESGDAKIDSEMSVMNSELVLEPKQARSVSHSPEPPKKRRRRSISSSSTDSVSTISTVASRKNDDHDSEPQSRPSPLSMRQRRRLNQSTSRSPIRSKEKSSNRRSRSLSRTSDKSQHQDNDQDRNLLSENRAKSNYRSKRVSLQRQKESYLREARRSESPHSRPNLRDEPRQYRQRSLSPYSRRLALTHAMNANR